MISEVSPEEALLEGKQVRKKSGEYNNIKHQYKDPEDKGITNKVILLVVIICLVVALCFATGVHNF